MGTMSHLSRERRIEKLRDLLPICPFVDFRDGEYKLLFPYPHLRRYVEFDQVGRVTNYVTGDGLIVIDTTKLIKSSVRQERAELGELSDMINRRINYLHARYTKPNSRDYIGDRDRPGRSREGYDAQSNANRAKNKVLTDIVGSSSSL